MRPSCSITSSSPSRRALGMLWVTTTSVVPPALLSSSSRSSISSAVIGSSPALGSSTSRIGGSSAIARARPARLRMPPGQRRRHLVDIRAPGRPRRASPAPARGSRCRPVPGVPPQRERDVLAHRDRIEERGVLEQEARSAAARATARGPCSALISSSSHEHASRVGLHQADDVPQRDALAGAAPARGSRSPGPAAPRTTRRRAPARSPNALVT